MSILDPPREVPRGTLLARLLRRADARAVDPVPSSPPATSIPLVPLKPAPASGTASPSEQRLYLEARRQIKRRAWGFAQRALEEATLSEPDSPAGLDLRSVRTIRRSLRRLSRWPSDVDSHLELGRAYFDLDLGEEALAEFLQVQRLAPHRHEGFALATLEYLYRGEYAIAVSVWARARALNPELPPLDEVMGSLPMS